jgi:DNA polymerase I-like protein with 3'-5' exonuclease and polymerase domains
MIITPTDNQAYQLLHEGTIALSQVEANGIAIDVEYLARALDKTEDEIKQKTEALKEDKVAKLWKRKYGGKTNFDSRTQLSNILFKEMGLPNPNKTASQERFSADEDALDKLDLPFVKDYLYLARLKKARSTYLKGIQREVVNGFLHPVFNLGIAATFRSTSDSPNFQNMPVRIPWIAELIRQCFIPRPGRQLVEIDYGRIEVCGSTCYHKDPVMIKYLKDPTTDMHRDCAMDCYILPQNKVDKDIRYCAKNMFVFPEFYGDYYIDCAKNLWNAISQKNLHLPDGTSLYKHLKKKGIKELGKCDPDMRPLPGTFEKHIQEVENIFWNERFKVYSKWKKQWWEAYQETGGFTMLTGFHVEGVYKRNEVINYPIQGISFHFLLWSLIQIQKILKKEKMKSLIVGQIHDSIVSDVAKGELKDFLAICEQVMTKDIREHWPWIIIPLEIEAEVCDVDKSWFEKKKYKEAA